MKKLFALKHSHVEDGFMISDEQRADFLVTDKVHGEPLRTVVQCVTTKQGRADEQMLVPMLGFLMKAKNLGRVDRGMIITDSGLSPTAQGQAEGSGWKVRRYDDLIAELMDFSSYCDDLIGDFTKPPLYSGNMPALDKYYVPLKAESERDQKDAKPFPLLPFVLDWITRPSPAPPLMLLGEYGTGKTTFARKLAYELAKRHREAQDRLTAGKPSDSWPRIPILINLLDFQGKIESLITYYLGERCHVANLRFQLFEKMNEAGLFVLILDGFDEMAVRADSDTIEMQLCQIETLAKPNARVLLTGRPEFFMSRQEFERAMWPRRDRLAERFKDYEPIRLTLWDDGQIDTFLQSLVPHLPDAAGDWKYYRQRIDNIPGFADDLAQRAVLLEMIVKTLPEIPKNETVNRPNLYRRYLLKELRRQKVEKGRKLLLEDETRFRLLQRLAADSYKSEGAGISYAAAKELVKPQMPAWEQESAEKVAHQTRDFLQCAFLKPAPQDIFIFSHRSFRGYFAAKELMPRLLDGAVQLQPIDQDCIGFLAEMMTEICTENWYRRQVEAALKKEGLPDWIKKKGDRYFSELPEKGPEVEMVYVPAGPFVLGAEADGLSPQIAIVEKGFWMDKTPVTNEQYKSFLDANPKHPAPLVNQDWAKPYNWNGRNFPKGAEIHPVVLVSWEDAQAFRKWAKKELPTEQQWEKAARGIDGRTYPWGNVWDRDKCNSASWWAKRELLDYEKEWRPWWEKEYPKKFAGKMMTTPVGHFSGIESPYGCVDSAGNVWEWCADEWQKGSNARVLRGGAWDDRPQNVACAVRVNLDPDGRSYVGIGFRCART